MGEGRITNILVVGIGGQGVLTATEILAEAAIALGHDVKKTEVAGMAQRGGVVTSHLRFGPKVLAPAMSAGEADVILAFEAAEAKRWANWVRPGGAVVVNDLKVVPPIVSSGVCSYPEDPIGEMRADGVKLFVVDAAAIAERLGNPRLANTVMLGAAADFLGMDPGLLRDSIARRFAAKPGMPELNARAFEAGRAATAEIAAAS